MSNRRKDLQDLLILLSNRDRYLEEIEYAINKIKTAKELLEEVQKQIDEHPLEKELKLSKG